VWWGRRIPTPFLGTAADPSIQSAPTVRLSRGRWSRGVPAGKVAPMQTTTATSVFIAEDSNALRARLVEMLSEVDGVDVVGEAETPEAAIAGILASRPNFVVLDYQLLGGTGVDVLQAVRAKTPDTVFIVLTNHPLLQYRRVCMAAGADCFFDKSADFEKVKQVIAGLRTV